MTTRSTMVCWAWMAMLAGCSGSTYTATATLRVGIEEPAMVGQPRQSSDERYTIYKNTQRQLVTSRFVLLAALRKPEVARLPSVQQAGRRGDAVKWLDRHIEVKSPDNSEIMTISVTQSDPREAVALARAVTDAYLAEVVNAEQAQKRQRLSELDRVYVEKETEVRGRRKNLKKLAEQLGTSDSKTLTIKQRLAMEELTVYRQELIKVQLELVRLKHELDLQKAALADAKESERDALRKDLKKAETAVDVVARQEAQLHAEVDAKKREAEKFCMSTVDMEMLREEIKTSVAVLAEIGEEREKVKIACRVAPRVTLLQRAEMPEESAKPSE
ncbi:MAG: hypothetical protein ABFC77_15150 [Thermoguttaceae bacterium]